MLVYNILMNNQDRQMVHLYQRGIASYVIAKKFGVSNSYVRGLLKKSGVKLRGHGVTNKMSARRRSPAQNKRITEAASEANRGSKHTMLHRSRLALSREKNPTIDPTYERPLVNLCREMGVKVIPQKAFSKFNVDLYLPESNVVIEIFGGGFHNKKDAIDLFNNKMLYLSTKKIPVVIVWSDKLTFSPETVLDISLSAKEQITIINGDGTPTDRGRRDIAI